MGEIIMTELLENQRAGCAEDEMLTEEQLQSLFRLSDKGEPVNINGLTLTRDDLQMLKEVVQTGSGVCLLRESHCFHALESVRETGESSRTDNQQTIHHIEVGT